MPKNRYQAIEKHHASIETGSQSIKNANSMSINQVEELLATNTTKSEAMPDEWIYLY